MAFAWRPQGRIPRDVDDLICRQPGNPRATNVLDGAVKVAKGRLNPFALARKAAPLPQIVGHDDERVRSLAQKRRTSRVAAAFLLRTFCVMQTAIGSDAASSGYTSAAAHVLR